MRWPLPWPKAWRSREPPAGEPTGPGEAASFEEEVPEAPHDPRQSAIPFVPRPVILFVRDLGMAILVVVLVMVVLFAYTRVWPPMVVVESRSMQHSNEVSSVGVIDTGDLVLVQDVAVPSDIVPWVEGRATGYRTYSDFGDVIIFLRPNQAPGSTPIIHRAYAFVIENATEGADVPALLQLPSTSWDSISVNGSVGRFAYGIWEFTLRNAGWQGDRTLRFNASSLLSRAGVGAGFLTKGDNNPDVDPYGAIHVDRVLGKARGELPWFGLIKLTLARGESGCCNGWGDPTAPKNSWDSLLVSLVVILAGPFLVDFGWAWFMKQRRARRGSVQAPEVGTETVRSESSHADKDVAPVEPPEGPTSAEPDLTGEARRESSAPEDDDP